MLFKSKLRKLGLTEARHIWTRSKQPWVTFGDGDETLEGQPPE